MFEGRAALRGSAIVIGALILGIGSIMADVIRDGVSPFSYVEVRHLGLPLVVTAVAAVASRGAWHRQSIVKAMAYGGLGVTVLSLIGYVGRLVLGDLDPGNDAFVLVQPHPVFDMVPRMTGTYGRSPQHMGEYAITVLALAAYLRSEEPQRKLWRWLSGAAAICIVLTFSFAWVGVVPLALYALRPRLLRLGRAWWVAALFGGAGGVGLACWLVVVGLPATGGNAPCISMDSAHVVTARIDELPYRDAQCRYLTESQPYEHRLTPYHSALIASARAIRKAPLLGVGRERFAAHGDSAIEQRHNLPTDASRGVYRSPHSMWLGIPALNGLVGWLGGGLVLFGLWRIRPSRRPETAWLWCGCIGLAAIGLLIDVHYQRHGWILLGLVAAHAWEPNSRPQRATDQSETISHG